MIDWGVVALLIAGSAGAGAVPQSAPIQLARLIVREQMTIRIRPRPRAMSPALSWRERRGPKCIPAKAIAGAALLGPRSVDVLLRNNMRIRARLEDNCPAIDFYRGFYIKPNADGMICADRDAIRSRMGGQCEIETFRKLIPTNGD